jgi:hypothetical protein
VCKERLSALSSERASRGRDLLEAGGLLASRTAAKQARRLTLDAVGALFFATRVRSRSRGDEVLTRDH